MERLATGKRCPTCASEQVYCLLDTLHCKRCGSMWKGEKVKKHVHHGGGTGPVTRRVIVQKRGWRRVSGVPPDRRDPAPDTRAP